VECPSVQKPKKLQETMADASLDDRLQGYVCMVRYDFSGQICHSVGGKRKYVEFPASEAAFPNGAPKTGQRVAFELSGSSDQPHRALKVALHREEKTSLQPSSSQQAEHNSSRSVVKAAEAEKSVRQSSRSRSRSLRRAAHQASDEALQLQPQEQLISEDVPTSSLQALRTWQKQRLVEFGMLQDKSREVMIAEVIKESRNALCGGDSQAMVACVTAILALLSPPRNVPVEDEEGNEMTEEAQQRLRSCQQFQLRKLLLQLLGLDGDNGLALEDSEMMDCLRVPLSRLEDWKASASERLACAAQWHRLFQAVDVESTTLPLSLAGDEAERRPVMVLDDKKTAETFEGGVALVVSKSELQSLRSDTEKAVTGHGQQSLEQETVRSDIGEDDRRQQKGWSESEKQRLLEAVDRVKAKSDKLSQSDWRDIGQQLGGRSADSVIKCYLKATDERYRMEKNTIRHEKGTITSMVKHALQKLGGKATIPEVVEFCKSDAAIQLKYGQRLSHQPCKISGSTKELPGWVRSISTNMGGFCNTTGEKRAGRKVYTLKQSRFLP